MQLGIGEIFFKASQLEGEEQVAFMRKNWSAGLGKMIEYALEPEYQWDLPPGTPPYKENKYFDQEGNLYGEVRRMYIFMKGAGDHVSPIKKETNFVGLLENVNKYDAEFLVHAKEKTLPYGFTAVKIREVFPGLIYETTVENQNPQFGRLADEELGFVPEEVVDNSAVPFTDEQMIAMATAEVIIPPDQPAPEAPVKKPRAPAKPKTPSTRGNTAKSGSVTSKAKKPVVRKRKIGESTRTQ